MAEASEYAAVANEYGLGLTNRCWPLGLTNRVCG